jgi:hypothetical protein
MRLFATLVFTTLLSFAALAQNPERFGGEGMQAGQGRPMRERFTPEQRAEMKTERMKESLNLSEEQLAQISQINLEAAQADQLSREQMREFMTKMREEQLARDAAIEAKYKEILNDSQYKKWLKQKQQQQNRAPQFGQFGQGMPRGQGYPPNGMGDRGGFNGGQGGFSSGGFSNEMGF